MSHAGYKLDEQWNVVPCHDWVEWGAWMEGADRKINHTVVYPPGIEEGTLGEGVHVSTVFLGIDHQHGDGPPLLFETMVWVEVEDNGHNQGRHWLDGCLRYADADQAQWGHEAVVKLVGQLLGGGELGRAKLLAEGIVP